MPPYRKCRITSPTCYTQIELILTNIVEKTADVSDDTRDFMRVADLIVFINSV